LIEKLLFYHLKDSYSYRIIRESW